MDRRLGHVNTEPDPKEVEVMVETERAGARKDAAAGDDGAAPAQPPATGASKSRSNPN